MQIKQYDKQGVVAWSNSKVHSELLASASFQEENELYNLDILSLDLQERSKKINVIGNGYADSPFRCIAWDNFGEKQNLYSHGLIFTGMEDISFKLWNPAEMIATYPTRPAPSLQNIDQQPYIIYEQAINSQHPITCAQWNSLNNNILAFGTTDVFILILNKGQATDPDLRKPGKKNPHNGSYVTSVSWNREVAHILASASENGLVALWDIKTNNSIFQFRDSGASTSGNRNVEICWSKSISTQIAVTLDDEKHNELQIWDLRNQKGPVVVIDKFHTKGINAMDWCETDPELILTSSRDKKIACWNYTQEEEPLSQTTLQSQTVSVKWSKKLPSIYSVSTDEKTYVYTLNDANLFSYVPKWYKVPVGSTILGNESILTYSQKKGNALHENRLADHNKKSVIRPKLKAISKIVAHEEEQGESDLVNLLKAKNAQSNDTEIYDYLGFNKGKIVQEVQKYTGKKREFAAPNQKQKTTKHKPKAFSQIQGQDALAFFASINNQSFQQNAKNDQDENIQRVQYDMVPRNFNWDLGKQKIVKQNILIGNYQGAIDAALKCGRTAEALIIAYSVDQNLFNNTLKTFFTETTDSFITDVLKHIAYKDALELVKKYDLNKWKECIALIYSIAGRDKRPQLLKVLAGRLRAQSAETEIENERQIIPQSYPAIICYILAEDFIQVTKIYFENLKLFESGTQQRKLAAIEYARRLILIYLHLSIEVPHSKPFHKIVREVAFIALQEHQKILAHQLLVTYSNAHKTIDYLITNTKQLQQYQASINHKPILLPLMQIKKQEKKNISKGNPKGNAQTNRPISQNQSQPQKPKAKIFDKQEERVAPPPPGPPKKRVVQQANESSGFSPYDNQPQKQTPAQQPQPPIKKNLNTPPPMPISSKKVIHIPQQEEEVKEIKREVPSQPVKNIPAPIKKPPPPPIANQYNTSNNQQQKQQYTHKQPSIPEKKVPPPTFQKPNPPPPKQIVQTPQKQQFVQQVQQQAPKIKPPPMKQPPQRPIQAEKVEIPRRQEPPKKIAPKMPPPAKFQQQPRQTPPPSKIQQRKYQQPQQQVVKKLPPPQLPQPPPKRNVPPPPVRK